MKNYRSYLLYLITLIAALIAIFILRHKIVSAEYPNGFLSYPWFLLIATAIFLIQESLNPVVAQLALKSVGETTKYMQQLLITIITTSANSTVPVPAGMPIRAFLQKNLFNISYTKSTIAMFIETVFGYGLNILIAIITSIIWFREASIEKFFLQYNRLLILITGFVVLVLMIVVVVLYMKKCQLIKQLATAKNQLLQIKIIPLFGITVVILCSFALALLRFEMILCAMGIKSECGPLMAALLISRIAGVLSFVPMGLGVRDASLASLLFMIGIPLTHAAAGAAIDRIIMIIPYLVGGVIASHLLGKSLLVSK
ncbi:MAG: lysylphosphatidylglycerol synthase domain-containing protein [Desulfamplus sp.]